MPYVIAQVVLVAMYFIAGALSLEIEGVRLANLFIDITDEGLGKSSLQEQIYSRATLRSHLVRRGRGMEIVEKLANSVEERFSTYSRITKEIHREIEDQYVLTDVNVTTIIECCKLNSTVNARGCYQKTADRGKVRFPMAVMDKMEHVTKQFSHIKWAYFGNEKGDMLLFPADTASNCYEYDPRLRPWYAEASAPLPKDIVIAYDVTAKSKLSLIRSAIETLLNTTNPNDRITVIKYGKRIRTHLGTSDRSTCFSLNLALATPQNRKSFIHFLYEDDDISNGAAEFQPAFDKALQYFENAADNTGRNKLLVFIAGSNLLDDTSINVQSLLDKKAVIQTLAFGRGLSNETLRVLKDIAEYSGFTTSDKIEHKGTFSHIMDGSQLRAQLYPYYNIFSDSAPVTEPIVPVPYFDYSNTGGLVVSLCLPVHSNLQLEGVNCVDADLEDIFFNVTSYHEGFDTYAFIIDSRGRTILHPNLPKPKNKYADPAFVDISTLERDDAALEIIASMKNGRNGSKTFIKQFNGGTNVKGMASHFFWTKVPKTDYSLCLVFSDRDGELVVNLKDDLVKYDVSYTHPYMLLHPKQHSELSRCTYSNTLVTKDVSVTKFTKSAYKWLSDCVDSHDRVQSQKYENFFIDGAYDQAPELRERTRWWVALSGVVDEIWQDDTSSAYNTLILWRHLATVSGIIKVYPGTSFTRYEPRDFAWYTETVVNQSPIQIHPIEKEDRYCLMISSAITAGMPNALPVAVLGGELRQSALYQTLETLYPKCRSARCFIVDDVGQVLVHKDYTGTETYPAHLISMESEVANYLRDTANLQKKSCLDLDKYRTILSWKLSLKSWFVESESPSFELHRVPGTNVFLGIVFQPKGDLKCLCKNLTECSREYWADNCECPCYANLKFNSCNNTLPDRSLAPTCSLLRKDFDIIYPVQMDDPSTFDGCMGMKCEDIPSQGECSRQYGCTWCTLEHQKDEFSKCHKSTHCLPLIAVAGASRTKTSNETMTILVAIILILFVATVVFLVVIRIKPVKERCSSLMHCLSKEKTIGPATTVTDLNTTRNPSSPTPSGMSLDVSRLPAPLPYTSGYNGPDSPKYHQIEHPLSPADVITAMAPSYQGQSGYPSMASTLPSANRFLPIAQSSGFSAFGSVELIPEAPMDTDEELKPVVYSPFVKTVRPDCNGVVYSPARKHGPSKVIINSLYYQYPSLGRQGPHGPVNNNEQPFDDFDSGTGSPSNVSSLRETGFPPLYQESTSHDKSIYGHSGRTDLSQNYQHEGPDRSQNKPQYNQGRSPDQGSPKSPLPRTDSLHETDVITYPPLPSREGRPLWRAPFELNPDLSRSLPEEPDSATGIGPHHEVGPLTEPLDLTLSFETTLRKSQEDNADCTRDWAISSNEDNTIVPGRGIIMDPVTSYHPRHRWQSNPALNDDSLIGGGGVGGEGGGGFHSRSYVSASGPVAFLDGVDQSNSSILQPSELSMRCNESEIAAAGQAIAAAHGSSGGQLKVTRPGTTKSTSSSDSGVLSDGEHVHRNQSETRIKEPYESSI